MATKKKSEAPKKEETPKEEPKEEVDAILPDETEGESEDKSQEDSKDEADETKESDEKEDSDKEESKESQTEKPEDETEEKPEEESEESQDDKPEEEPDQKEQARKAYQERRQNRERIKEQIQKSYGPKTQDEITQELVDQGVSESEAQNKAEVEALRQEMQFDRELNKVSDLNAKIIQDAKQARKDFPIFDPNNKEEFDPEYSERVDNMFIRAARLQRDDSGIIVNADEDLYDFYAEAAKLYGQGSSKSEAKAQKNAVKMMSRSESPTSGSEATSEEDDPFLKGFNKVT